MTYTRVNTVLFLSYAFKLCFKHNYSIEFTSIKINIVLVYAGLSRRPQSITLIHGSVYKLKIICVPIQVHVEFSDEKDSVSLEGPPQEVEKAQESLETFIRELVS